MSTQPIAANVLGQQAEAASDDEVARLTATLERLDSEAWARPTPCGEAPVAVVAAHLAEGAHRLAIAWEHQVDAEADEILLHTFDDPSSAPEVEMDTSDPAAVLGAYREATHRLSRALGTVRQQDWTWPVWSPLGGVETLGEAVRRWLAHHHVHRSDILVALNRELHSEEATETLVAEFVLDALARRGGEAVPGPMVFEAVTNLPGAGTWSLVFDEPAPRAEITSVWHAIVDQYPQPTQRHRVERGSTGQARLVLRCSGATLWRAAFGRGATWGDVEVHGDDQARQAWVQLLERVSEVSGPALGRVQH